MARGLLPTVLSLLLASGCTEDPKLSQEGGRIGTGNAGGTGGAGAAGGAGGNAAASDAGCPEPPASEPDPGLPCEVEAIFASVCRRCHDTEEALAVCEAAEECLIAPFPLRSWADTRAIYGEVAVYQRIGHAVESGFMPLQTDQVSPPQGPLDEALQQVLIGWAEGCAEARAPGESCGDGG